MIYKLWFPWRSDGTEKGSKYTRKEGRKEGKKDGQTVMVACVGRGAEFKRGVFVL